MRLLPIAAAGLTLAVVGGAAGITAVGASHHSAFASRSASLQHRWDVDMAEGVPAVAIGPLRHRLTSSSYQAPWWSPTWWTSTGSGLLDDLDRRTEQAWQSALASGRADAQAAIDGWKQLQQQLGSYLPAGSAAEAAAWPAQAAAATTPAALARLAAQWDGALVSARQQAQAAQVAAQQAAALDAQVSTYGGVRGLLAQAQAALQTAQSDNLDPGDLPALVSQLQTESQGGTARSSTLDQVATALQSLRSLISLNDAVAAGLRPLLLSVDQASAEGIPTAASFQNRYGAAAASLTAARTGAELTAVQQQLSSLSGAVNAELSASRCGHAVGSGKVIAINLSLQEAVFYEDGCAVQAGPVTTGRPELRTPTGTFHVFYKQAPFEFFSPWPKGSPFYYVPSWSNWVMEFAGGGFFIHDAPWQPEWQLGPGSENSAGASHGCVHLAGALMRWAYGWAPYGTTVVITS